MRNNLHDAKKRKNDEFYTRYEDVDAELSLYGWSGASVFLPADDPSRSAFWKWFHDRFHSLGLRRLGCSWLGGRVVEYDGRSHTERPLRSGGDILSDEVRAIMRRYGTVVTNPPFSLSLSL